MRRLIKITTSFLIFGLIFCFAFAAPTDPDFGSHLRYGEFILKERKIPNTDFLTYTYFGKPYASHEWLFEVATFLIFKNFSFLGLTIVSTIFVFVSFYFLVKLFSTTFFKFLAVFFAALISAPIVNGGFRPQLMTIFGTSFLIFSLIKLEKGERRYALFLPLVFLVWSNTHASYLAGLAIIGLYWFDKLIKFFLKRKAKPEFSFLILISLATGIASLLTPFSPFIFKLFFVLTRQVLFPSFLLGQGTEASTAKTTVIEWMPPFFLAYPGFTYLVFVLITGLLFIFWLRKFSLWEVLTIILFAYLAGVSRRHMAFFAFSICPIVLFKLEKNLKMEKIIHLKEKIKLLILIMGIMVVAALNYQKMFTTLRLIKSQEDYFRLSSYPYLAVEYIKAHPLKGYMFNYYNWGGFLNWQLPQYRVFIDGRLPQSQFLIDYLNITGLEKGWYEKLESYDVSWVILPAPSKLVKTLKEEKGWKEVYKDVLTSIIVKP